MAMPSSKDGSNHDSVPITKRQLEKTILITLVFDFIYVLAAMIAMHMLSFVANLLGMVGDEGIFQSILRLSGSFYLTIYLFLVTKSILHILLGGIKDLIDDIRDLIDEIRDLIGRIRKI